MTRTKYTHVPKRLSERKCAEDCAQGDVIEYARPPKVQEGQLVVSAPSRIGEVVRVVGPEPHMAFVRFVLELSGAKTRPMLVKTCQPMRVTEAHQ